MHTCMHISHTHVFAHINIYKCIHVYTYVWPIRIIGMLNVNLNTSKWIIVVSGIHSTNTLIDNGKYIYIL